MRAGTLVLTLSALLSMAPDAAAQQVGPERTAPDLARGSYDDPEAYPRPVGNAFRAAVAPQVDGRLDDAVWQSAEVLTDFIQSQPNAGALATERTEVRILYTDEAIYIGAMNYDSQAGSYVVQSLERDFPSLSTRDADIFGVTLDTFLDRRDSFIFLINPYGAYRDGQTFNDSRNTDFGFDIPIQVETARLEEGWSVELRIPWAGLRYDGARVEQVFGLNLLRRVRRVNEDSYWAPLERRDPVHRMSKAGTLNGIRGIPGSSNLSLKPYALAADQAGSTLDVSAEGARADFGGELKYGVTPGLTLDLTYNTDFSQVEVDQERVNLTRFPLFFPEQRDFFVENSGSFAFGDQTERNYRAGASLRDFTLFHSRRIGLLDGRPVPIIAGGRLSGRMAGFDVGVLDMRTEGAGEMPGENFAVLRMKREVAPGSDVGAMFIERSPVDQPGAEASRSYGLDANVRLFGGLIVSSYLARTETPAAEGDQTAARFGAAWRDRTWNLAALYRRIGDDFRPEMGFVRRRDIKHIYATVGTHRRPGVSWIQEVAPYVEMHRFNNLRDTLVTREIQGGVRVDLSSGASLNASVARRYELVETPFTVSAGTIPEGGYDFNEASVSFQSSAGRPFSANVRISGGGFYSGDRRSVGGRLRWLVSHQLAVNASADFNRIDLPEGSFTSAVYSGRVKYGFNTRVFLALNVQYNDDLDQLVTYGRLNFIHGPLSDLFLVLSERRHLGGGGGVLERAFTIKATKLLTF